MGELLPCPFCATAVVRSRDNARVIRHGWITGSCPLEGREFFAEQWAMLDRASPQPSAEAARSDEEVAQAVMDIVGPLCDRGTFEAPGWAIHCAHAALNWDNPERLGKLAQHAPVPAGAVSDGKAAFKNFHRSLCARFGHTHDEAYWWRDLVSLEEHIASRIASHPAQAVVRDAHGSVPSLNDWREAIERWYDSALSDEEWNSIVFDATQLALSQTPSPPQQEKDHG